MVGRRHSLHIDGRYSEGSDPKAASPLVVGGDNTDLLYLSPPTVKKKKVKDKSKKSKDKKKITPDPIIGDGSVSESGATAEKEKKKKRKSKKYRYNSEALGVVIIPDCDDDVYEDEREIQDKSAYFTAVTEQTERTEQTTLLDDDDFTAATKDTKEESLKKSPKKKKETKETRSKSKNRSKSKGRSKSHGNRGPLKHRRSSVENHRKKSITKENITNASWGDNPEGEKTFMAPELLNLLMDPAMQIDSESDKQRTAKKRPDMKRSNSFGGPKNPPSLSNTTRRNSVGNLSSRVLDSKSRNRPKRKIKKDLANGASNETWGVESSVANQRASYSPELLNLYNSKKAEKPSPLLTRNAKSFNCVGQANEGENKRDNDIPSILFLHPENSHCTLNDSWENKTPSTVRGKPMIGKNASKQNESRGGLDPISPGALSPRIRRKGSVSGNKNETWGESPGRRSPVSPEVAAMLLYSGPSPKTQAKNKSKSPSALKKSMSFGGAIKNSPSLLKSSFANFKKLRNGKQLQEIPDLGL